VHATHRSADMFAESSLRRNGSDDAASARSTSSAESGADVATRKMVNGWKKITGMN
jgi:hypothetical protein